MTEYRVERNRFAVAASIERGSVQLALSALLIPLRNTGFVNLRRSASLSQLWLKSTRRAFTVRPARVQRESPTLLPLELRMYIVGMSLEPSWR